MDKKNCWAGYYPTQQYCSQRNRGMASIINRNCLKSKHQDHAGNSEQVFSSRDTPTRRIVAFAFLVTGILANLYLPPVKAHFTDPSTPISIGSFSEVCARIFFSLCIAGVTFLPIYQKLSQQPTMDWTVLAISSFQQGFFWNAAFNGVMQDLN